MIRTDLGVRCPMRILVVEDNPLNQLLITRLLEKMGYKADLANDGLEALEQLNKSVYDLVLMDVQMPNMDGLEATRNIRKLHGSSPLIMAVTANAMVEDREDCLRAGMDDYLSKPVNVELFMDKLESLYHRLSG
jgi:CheY-like chemotaxis protein